MEIIKNNEESKKTTMAVKGLKKGIENIKKKSSTPDDITLHFYSFDSSVIAGELVLDDSFINGIGDLHAIKQYLSEIAGEEVVLSW